MTEWRIIENFPDYMVSSEGEIKNIKTNTILKTFKNNKNYLTVRIYKDKKGYTQRVHRLVAETFIPNPDNKPEIDHINTDKSDNSVKNLRWTTSKENSNNPLTKINNYKNHARGDIHGQSKKIKILDTTTNEISIYSCIKNASDELLIKYSTLRSALRKNSIINKKYMIKEI